MRGGGQPWGQQPATLRMKGEGFVVVLIKMRPERRAQHPKLLRHIGVGPAAPSSSTGSATETSWKTQPGLSGIQARSHSMEFEHGHVRSLLCCRGTGMVTPVTPGTGISRHSSAAPGHAGELGGASSHLLPRERTKMKLPTIEKPPGDRAFVLYIFVCIYIERYLYIYR